MPRQSKQKEKGRLKRFEEQTTQVVEYFVKNSWATKETFMSMGDHPDIDEKIQLLARIIHKNDSQKQLNLHTLLHYGMDSNMIMSVITRPNGLRELKQHAQKATYMIEKARRLTQHYVTQFGASEESFRELMTQSGHHAYKKLEFLRGLAIRHDHPNGACSKLELLLSRGHNIHSIMQTLTEPTGIHLLENMLQDINCGSCPDSPCEPFFVKQTLWSEQQSPTATLTVDMLEAPKAQAGNSMG